VSHVTAREERGSGRTSNDVPGREIAYDRYQRRQELAVIRFVKEVGQSRVRVSGTGESPVFVPSRSWKNRAFRGGPSRAPTAALGLGNTDFEPQKTPRSRWGFLSMDDLGPGKKTQILQGRVPMFDIRTRWEGAGAGDAGGTLFGGQNTPGPAS